ncbi:MAG TPA: hypothetical protein DDW34_03375, partial [Clostridium sp.]|nr:hypothetical protein [Clostridium sp.]
YKKRGFISFKQKLNWRKNNEKEIYVHSAYPCMILALLPMIAMAAPATPTTNVTGEAWTTYTEKALIGFKLKHIGRNQMVKFRALFPMILWLRWWKKCLTDTRKWYGTARRITLGLQSLKG